MSQPRVSVLMPVHNAEHTLPETLQSIQNQTYTEMEIVIVDDGSSDDSLHILEAAREQDPRLIISAQPHRGLIATLNEGLSLCRGPFVARMDADDLMHPERIEKQAALLASQADLSVASCLVETIAVPEVGEGMKIYEGWLNGLMHHDDIVREIFIESPVAHPSVMLKRHEIDQLGRYQDRGWPEDYDLWLRYHHAGKRFEKVPEVLLYWRDHPERATRTDSRYSVENFIRTKAHYLVAGPLRRCHDVLVWGAGQTGRRLSKHLIRLERSPSLFIDINPGKIGGTLRGIPISSADDLGELWPRFKRPLLLVAVASRGARGLIRKRLAELGLIEGTDYLCVA
ncbi:MAG: glycosyltransferase [Candidatus Latescibacteria bacterium]|nr:glycosyltransferase [Candidatus Latescibacterota bacterium]